MPIASGPNATHDVYEVIVAEKSLTGGQVDKVFRRRAAPVPPRS
ncbi:hypothetical protein G155_00092 [Mycobacterium sp. VKM Ac-1817D]|nr:hypothetical protein G155_00092 [Mycobacterium sp. VKM Ac-1817D]